MENASSLVLLPSAPIMNLRKPFSDSPAVGGSGRPASWNALRIPSVPPWAQMPSILGSDGSTAAVLRWATPESHCPENLLTILMPGCLENTDIPPAVRCVSTNVPGTPVTMRMFPLPWSLPTSHWASCLPNWNWSVLTVSAPFAATMLSKPMTRIPRWIASSTTPASPVGDAASMRIASTRAEMRSEICCACLARSLLAL